MCTTGSIFAFFGVSFWALFCFAILCVTFFFRMLKCALCLCIIAEPSVEMWTFFFFVVHVHQRHINQVFTSHFDFFSSEIDILMEQLLLHVFLSFFIFFINNIKAKMLGGRTCKVSTRLPNVCACFLLESVILRPN